MAKKFFCTYCHPSGRRESFWCEETTQNWLEAFNCQ
jgi:hypothetical protein